MTKGGQNIGEQTKMKTFKFYDFAPMVFRRIRKLFGIIEQDYIHSLGPEQVLAAFFSKNFDYL